MRYFNTFGPCNPEEHYTVIRDELIRKGMEKVKQGRYFTVFAPKKSGKTTFIQFLRRALEREGSYKPIYVSFKDLHEFSRSDFYQTVNHEIRRELNACSLAPDAKIHDHLSLMYLLEDVKKARPLVLMIDDFEYTPQVVHSELLHTFRAIFHTRNHASLHSLILAGVSNLGELIQSATFNIADELDFPEFSREETNELILQYQRETGQVFDKKLTRVIHQYTAGRPGVLCGLLKYMVEEVATDCSRAATMRDLKETIIQYQDKIIDENIIQIAHKSSDIRKLVSVLLFTAHTVRFNIQDPEIAYLYTHGLLKFVDGSADISLPLYKRRLLMALRPTISTETDQFDYDAHTEAGKYVSPDGLNVRALLDHFAAYIGKCKLLASGSKDPIDGAWHYSLESFIISNVSRLGGQTVIEIPSGRGRMDMTILFRDKRYTVEADNFIILDDFEKHKQQLAQYLKTEGLDEGYYVVFSKRHEESDVLFEDEVIDDKRIFTFIVRVNFDRPSKVRKKRQ